MIFAKTKDIDEKHCDFELSISGNSNVIANQLALILKKIEDEAPECLMRANAITMEAGEDDE